MTVREVVVLDVFGAAARLKVPVGAWRWAAAIGLVPPPDAAPDRWSTATVAAVDTEGVLAALVSTSARTAAERLTAALCDPLPPLRPAVTPR
ncbi:hypothetical protein AB0P15_31165 [Streptomyces sp. NPDC087917]|uniref:hypothetical protein n=1 Tax=Streptomyces sp. NPDC087917 TaxID=3155060 RepID=UPI0034409555